MNARILVNRNQDKASNFQKTCEDLSKQCAVLLAFVIPISTFATNLILLLLMITWFLSGNLSEKAKIIWMHPVARMVFVLFSVFLIGVLYSPASKREIIAMLGIGKMGKLLYIPFLLPLMQEEKWRRWAIWAFVASMFLTLILAVLKVYAGSLLVNRYSISSVFKDDIFTNLMMAFASFVIGHYMLAHPNFYTRAIFFALLSTVIFYVLFISQGRSGYIIFSALWLLLSLQRLKIKGLVFGLIALVTILVIAFSFSAPFQNRILAAVDNFKNFQDGQSNTSLGARLEFVKQTWGLSKQRLWFGYGTGSFKQVYENHANTQNLMSTQNPHNEYVNILLQVGLIGLSTFLGLFVVMFKSSYNLPKPEQWLAQGVLVAMLIGCFGNSWLMDFTSGYFFVSLTAFCFGALNIQRRIVI